VDIAVHKPSIFSDNEATRFVAQFELVEALLETLHTSEPVTHSRRDRTRQVYSQIIRTVESHLLSVPNERLSVTDLCQLSGVSERTLQYAFQEIMGMTPMAYLKRLRLHRVRETLCSSPQRSTRITLVAQEWGFWHFGEFSRDYRNCFGESPSRTLKDRRNR